MIPAGIFSSLSTHMYCLEFSLHITTLQVSNASSEHRASIRPFSSKISSLSKRRFKRS